MQTLASEIIPRFGLPRILQSDNGPSFKAAVTEGFSKAWGIQYYLYCAERPESSGKVEKANYLKRHLRKLGDTPVLAYSTPHCLIKDQEHSPDAGAKSL
jgi:hypothetical protein